MSAGRRAQSLCSIAYSQFNDVYLIGGNTLGQKDISTHPRENKIMMNSFRSKGTTNAARVDRPRAVRANSGTQHAMLHSRRVKNNDGTERNTGATVAIRQDISEESARSRAQLNIRETVPSAELEGQPATRARSPSSEPRRREPSNKVRALPATHRQILSRSMLLLRNIGIILVFVYPFYAFVTFSTAMAFLRFI